jgi:hypothetical protein
MKGRRKKRDAQWECMLRYREEEPHGGQALDQPTTIFARREPRGLLLELAGPMASPRKEVAY